MRGRRVGQAAMPTTCQPSCYCASCCCCLARRGRPSHPLPPALLLPAIAVVAMLVSRRRERRIDRAAKLRMTSRRQRDAAEAAENGGGGESAWRAAYSARMAESMRRAEETVARQHSQASGPSFLEAQDKEFAKQAGGSTPSLSSKKSCECRRLRWAATGGALRRRRRRRQRALLTGPSLAPAAACSRPCAVDRPLVADARGWAK